KFYFSNGYRIFRKSCRAIVDIRLRRQDEIQAAHGSGTSLENIGDPAEGNHGPDQLVQVEEESDERAECNLAAKQLMPPLPEDEQKNLSEPPLAGRDQKTPGSE